MENGSEILLDPEVEREMRTHGAATYPHECCGAMLGRAGADAKLVTRTLRIENARTDSAHNRFLVTDRDYLRCEREAADAGLDLLGFYHSHPDHPAKPSATDLASAMPWFSYVILAVEGGEPRELTSWVLAEDRSQFLEERVGAPEGRPAKKGANGTCP